MLVSVITLVVVVLVVVLVVIKSTIAAEPEIDDTLLSPPITKL